MLEHGCLLTVLVVPSLVTTLLYVMMNNCSKLTARADSGLVCSDVLGRLESEALMEFCVSSWMILLLPMMDNKYKLTNRSALCTWPGGGNSII